jgi:hypothetical protein
LEQRQSKFLEGVFGKWKTQNVKTADIQKFGIW